MTKKSLIILLLAFCGSLFYNAQAQGQNDTDSLVTLLSAQYVRLFEQDTTKYREVKGPAVFLHNGAYMYCDSAIWNLNRDIIDAFENVKLVQDKTVLSSDHLTYTVDQDLAEFTGIVVELSDADGNIFRSNNLTYNTKDSVAVSKKGGTMRDKDGNVIEGDTGTYDSKAKTFTFSGNTQVFMDTLFIRSTTIRYNSDENRVHFGRDTRIWYDTSFMTANDGWYDRDDETIFFRMDVYMNDPQYEGWCDEMYYYRNLATFDMFSNVQVVDTTHKAIMLSNSAHLVIDTLTNNMDVLLTQDPVLINYNKDQDQLDSLFLVADTIAYHTLQRWQVSDSLYQAGAALRQNILFDPIKEAEDQARESYERKKQEALEKSPEYQAMQRKRTFEARNALDSLQKANLPVPDSLYTILGMEIPLPEEAVDSTATPLLPEGVEPFMEIEEAPDSLFVPDTILPLEPLNDSTMVIGAKDSVATPDSTLLPQQGKLLKAPTALKAPSEQNPQEEVKDSTSVAFFTSYKNVKIYREDIQAGCDSLYYSGVDSVARLYGEPVIWENQKNQLTSDIMLFVLNEEGLYRGNLKENAMIVSQENGTYFNQIKSLEMLGYFKDNELTRYDALGGVNAILYLKENSSISTMNSKESRSLTVTMKDGNAQRLKYYESTKSDAYPVVELTAEQQQLKGFNWRGDERPTSRMSLTKKDIRKSERKTYALLIKPNFKTTNAYFDNYMDGVYKEIAINKFRKDSIARVNADLKAFEESFELYVNEQLIPYLEREDANLLKQLEEIYKNEVRLWGIEPQPEEPESSILSIKLQAQMSTSQNYNFSSFFLPLKENQAQNRSITALCLLQE